MNLDARLRAFPKFENRRKHWNLTEPSLGRLVWVRSIFASPVEDWSLEWQIIANMLSQRAEPSKASVKEWNGPVLPAICYQFLAQKSTAICMIHGLGSLKSTFADQEYTAGSYFFRLKTRLDALLSFSPTSVQCKHQPLQRSESVLTCFHNTTVVHKISSCSPRIAWLRSLWGAWNVINPDSARLTEVFLLLNRGTLNRGIQGVRKNEKMQGWGRF